ncbi:hypothetical protein BT96DRAFT_472407 [Gymnopus androsaceus JB14]|uniref:Uncharacterized protein n=1 Tax=Gymnopus androsaceus JB14 TaxID=1447944 RepID=A0A6A4I166_9AGAR|nr:hypothetical protein BT96DRAFT_472407 [Gymnopus androsaceus JB14]
MAVVSTLHSPSLEKSNSEFLGSNSPTPSPTSYKPHPSEVASPKPRQRPAFLPLNESAETLSQQSPPPSALIQPSRSQKQVGELEAGRPRGQSASSRPTLRLHIANPTDPPPVQPSYVQEQAVRSTLEALQARAQTIPSLYPSSVAAANSTGSTSPSRRRGETFSDFSNPSSGGISGLIAHTSHQIGSRSASPLPIRITTANLNYAASAVNTAPNSSSTSNSSGSGSASSTTRSNPISNKRPYRASPLVGPQAMATQSSATGTASSVSTAPTFVFSDDYYSSSVSTPATQESASSDFSHFTSPRVPAGPRNRPLPVPPPPTMGTPISTLSTISTIPTKTVSPLSAPAPPSLPPHPALSNHAALGYGHSRSSSTDLNLNDPINAELAYRLEKRRGKQPIRGDTAPSSPTEDEVPYELRSEKWKGKQRMRDSTYDALNSSPHEQFVSPVITNANAALPQRNDTNSFRSSDDRELGLPPSLSGTLSNRPSRASIASSHSSTRSGAGGISEGGVSKWKGKGKEVLKTMSISSISSLEKESAGSIAKFGKGRGVRKSGSVSSFTNPNSLRSDSPVSFSNSPAMSPAAPSIPSPFIAPAP